MDMTFNAYFLGFGEAAQSFCSDRRWQGQACGYDIKSTHAEHAVQKANDFKASAVVEVKNTEAMPYHTDFILSVVTADQAFLAAEALSGHLKLGTLFVDMNSVAPSTKQKSAEMLNACGVDYVDVAIMAPVYPKQLDVPLLISGEKALDAQGRLRELGFQNTQIVGEKIGQASSIKMLRSVMIKGLEALTAECAIAANRAGVLENVFGSMGPEWLGKADYNLDRMMVHGPRRAAEMVEVIKTLEDLNVAPIMSAGTVRRQQEIGEFGLIPPPAGLTQKLAAINSNLQEISQ